MKKDRAGLVENEPSARCPTCKSTNVNILLTLFDDEVRISKQNNDVPTDSPFSMDIDIRRLGIVTRVEDLEVVWWCWRQGPVVVGLMAK